MPYDEVLGARVRALIGDRAGVAERKMFGGVGFTVGGNIAVGIQGDDLIVRVPAEESEAAANEAHVRPMAMRGRGAIRGWLLVAPDATAGDDDLARWVERGFAHASSLPAK